MRDGFADFVNIERAYAVFGFFLVDVDVEKDGKGYLVFVATLTVETL